MKRTVSMITVLLMLVMAMVLAVPASAATNYASVKTNAEVYHVGDTVEVVIYLDYDAKVSSVGVVYTFDEEVLTLNEKASTWNAGFGGSFGVATITFNGQYQAAWSVFGDYGVNFSEIAEGAVKLVFDVNKIAEGDETELTFNVILANDGINETITLNLTTACDEHSYVEDPADKYLATEATCIEAATYYKSCKDCGVASTETFSSGSTIDHEYGEWEKNDKDTHIKYCTTEGCTASETEAHDWDDGVVTTEPTCSDTGVKTLTCEVCEETKTEDVPATGEHTFGDWVDNEDGTHSRECTGSTCNETETKDHVWDTGVITTEPTCSDEGVKTYTCECSATKTEAVPATGEHTFGEWVDNEDGTHSRECTGSTCNETETKDHVWDTGVITTEPTCSDEGVKTYTCECGATKTEAVPATGVHTYGAWETNGDAEHIRYCTGSACEAYETAAHDWANDCDTLCDTCGHTRTITHNYSTNLLFNATQHWQECVVCGDKTNVTAHSFVGETCAICSYTKPANQVMSGYIYVNDEYHMIVMTNGVITTNHVLNADGDCIFCLEHITDTEEVIIEIEDPIEPSTEEEEAPTVEETPEVEEAPATGITLGLTALLTSAFAFLLSKKR